MGTVKGHAEAVKIYAQFMRALDGRSFYRTRVEETGGGVFLFTVASAREKKVTRNKINGDPSTPEYFSVGQIKIPY